MRDEPGRAEPYCLDDPNIQLHLNDCTGSSLDARRAGQNPASIAAQASIAAATTKVTGSFGETWYNKDSTSLAPSMATGIPASTPSPVTSAASRSVDLMMSDARAPSAMRIPI